MEHYISKDALLLEIDRQKIGYNVDGKHSVEYYITRKIIDIINSLEVKEVQEEPVSNDLEEAAMQYAILKHKDAALQKIVSWDFKAGAEWQKEQMMKDAVYGLVCGHDESSPAWIDLNLLNKPNIKVGTEVKLIIIKNE